MADARWFNKVHRAANDQDYESWAEGGVVPTLNVADVGDSRAVTVVTSFHLTQTPIVGEDVTPLISSGSAQGQAVVGVMIEPEVYQGQGSNVGPMGTLRKGSGTVAGGVPFTAQARTVRRLTPRECERLQGFPDDHTAQRVELKAGKKQGTTVEQADSPRYKQMGNAVAVPVVQWLLERVAEVDQMEVTAFALRGRDGGAMPEVHGDGQTVGALRASGGGSSRDYLAVDVMEDDVQVYPILEVGKRTGTSTTDPRAGLGVGADGDPMFTLQAGAQHGVGIALDPTCANCGDDVGVHELCTDCLALIDPDAVPVPRALAHEVTAHLAQLGAAGDIPSLLLWHRLSQEVSA